jgi:hypothetical protein
MPRDYLKKFPGVEKDPQKAAQYTKARRHKANIASHYDRIVRRILKGEHKEK